jgi:hypothetical protein
MELDLMNRCVVNRGLGLSQASKYGQDAILDVRRQGAPAQDGFDVVQTAMLHSGSLHVYMEFRASDALPGNRLAGERIP